MKPVSIQIGGWGDVPTEEQFKVYNQAVLEKIRDTIEQELGVNPSQDAELRRQLEKVKAKTPEQWAKTTGIISRQWYPERSSTDLAIMAAERAVAVARRDDPFFHPRNIKLVISGGSSPDYVFPACACRIQDALGISDGTTEPLDVSLACCSGTQALITAIRAMVDDSFDQEPIDYALVSTGEAIGSRANCLLHEHGLLWGDGGGAVVLKRVHDDPGYGFLHFRSRSYGSLAGTTKSRGLGTALDNQGFGYIDASMEGRHFEIYEWTQREIPAALDDYVNATKLTVTDRTILLGHNGSVKILWGIGKKLGIDRENILHRLPDRGNQSSASVLSTLSFFADQNRFQRGDTLLFVTFGGGLAYNILTYRWP